MPDPIADDEFAQSLFLLDGSALAYRAHHAMSRSALSSAKGHPTGAVFGFASDLRRLLKRVRPRYAAVVFDRPEPTFRHRAYAAYKATREKMPEELVVQLGDIRRAAEVLGFRVIDLPGYEADDIIGTLTRKAEAGGVPVFIVTADKDMMQLVSPRVRLYNIFKKDEEVVIVGPREVEEKFGVAPARVTDILALMGDSSDNIPGIPGVGEKGAQKLIRTYGSLEALLEKPGTDVSPRIREALVTHREQGILSKSLATIDTDVPLGFEWDALAYAGPDAAAAAPFFLELGFRTFAEEMMALAPAAVSPATGPAPVTYTVVAGAAGLEALLRRLEGAGIAAVDTETTGLDARHARLVGFSFSVAAGEASYVPLNADPPVVPDPAGAARRGQGVIEALRPFLEDPSRPKCGQNAKYDLLVMRAHGLRPAGLVTDTLVASHLLEPEEREHNLDALALRHFQHRKIKTEELIGKGRSQITMDLVPVEVVGRYACEDADFTFRLAEKFRGRLAVADERMRRLHDDVEIPLVSVLVDMEETGVRVDRDRLRAMARELERRVEELRDEVWKAAGTEFNVDSPRQLGELLFEKLRVHEAPGCGYRPKKTATGGWATGQEILEDLAPHHRLPALVVEFRTVSKLLSTYLKPLPELVDPDTGRIHTTYNQSGAATGRISSNDPNLQNIPIRTEIGRRIRESFVPRDDAHVLLSADYSQVELRILAALSGDPALLRAFQEGADIHRDTAARVFGVPRESVDATLRSRAKAINFGILYGMGPQRLSRETGLTPEEARAFIERYFAAYPEIRKYLDRCKKDARDTGVVTTLLGRRRAIPDIRSENGAVRAAAENMAVNTPIQGSAADILKLAMVNIHRRLGQGGFGARMILTVHDELVFDVPVGEVEAVTGLVREEMEGPSSLGVPLRVDIGTGRTWLEAH